MVLLNPHYWERQGSADNLILKYNQYLPRVGFNLQSVFPHQEANLDKFTHLTNYGIIHIYSHGMAWPSDTNIVDIYVMTGEIENETSTKKYWEKIKCGDVCSDNLNKP